MNFRTLLKCLPLLVVAAASAAPTFTEVGATWLDTARLGAYSASLADIDRDGDLDLLFQGSTTTTATARRLFRNNVIGLGTQNFTNITATAGIVASDTNGWSAAWGDYNGDGWIDVFLGQANTAQNAKGDLFRNNGDGTFTNVTDATIPDPDFHQNVAWADIDNDQDLDLIIAMEGPQRHQIYLQGPAGSFTPVGAETGFQADYGTKAYGMALGDYDADGDVDIYIATCRQGGDIRNNFFQNRLVQDGVLSFVDIADDNGTQFMDNAYSTEFVDFDDDGDLDLYMTGADAKPTKIWRNNGDQPWTDVDTLLGRELLSDRGVDLNGSRAVDYDNDGDLDLFFHDNIAGKKARMLYRNDGGWNFTNVTDAEGFTAANEGAYDSAWGDLDLDGDLDLACATNSSNPERIFLSNASTNGNNWLQIRLKGPAWNTTAIGASVYATIHAGTPQQRTLRREANSNAGAFNQSDTPVHFGLGTATVIDRLRVHWPDKTWSEFHDFPVDRFVTLSPPTNAWMLQ